MSDNLCYVILNGRHPIYGQEYRYDQLYLLWKSGWEETFREDKIEYKSNANNFIRNDFVVGIFNDQNPIGFHAYSIFNLNSIAHSRHPYFDPFKSKAEERLRNLNVKSAFTMEYLFVHPEWRKTTSGMSLASILIQLGLRIFEQSSADVALGVGRNNRSVSRYAYEKGAVSLEQNIAMHGNTVDLFYFPKNELRNNLSDQEQDLAEKLWTDRIDPENLTYSTIEEEKVAHG